MTPRSKCGNSAPAAFGRSSDQNAMLPRSRQASVHFIQLNRPMLPKTASENTAKSASSYCRQDTKKCDLAAKTKAVACLKANFVPVFSRPPISALRSQKVGRSVFCLDFVGPRTHCQPAGSSRLATAERRTASPYRTHYNSTRNPHDNSSCDAQHYFLPRSAHPAASAATIFKNLARFFRQIAISISEGACRHPK